MVLSLIKVCLISNFINKGFSGIESVRIFRCLRCLFIILCLSFACLLVFVRKISAFNLVYSSPLFTKPIAALTVTLF